MDEGVSQYVRRISVLLLYPAVLIYPICITALALSEAAVEKFYRIYKKIDMDESGTIEIKEMVMRGAICPLPHVLLFFAQLVHFDIDRTKFTKRVFGVFDEDNSGEIDLREFIMALWNYCTLGKSTLVIFAFDLYDTDGSGVIDAQELDNMLKEVYGRFWNTNAYATRYAVCLCSISHSSLTHAIGITISG